VIAVRKKKMKWAGGGEAGNSRHPQMGGKLKDFSGIFIGVIREEKMKAL